MAPEPIENLGLPDEKMDPRWMEERKKILQTISKTNNGMEWYGSFSGFHRCNMKSLPVELQCACLRCARYLLHYIILHQSHTTRTSVHDTTLHYTPHYTTRHYTTLHGVHYTGTYALT